MVIRFEKISENAYSGRRRDSGKADFFLDINGKSFNLAVTASRSLP
jgi:hypothetical protein